MARNSQSQPFGKAISSCELGNNTFSREAASFLAVTDNFNAFFSCLFGITKVCFVRII